MKCINIDSISTPSKIPTFGRIKDSGPGDDLIPIKLIKIGISLIAPILVNVFSKSLVQGVFPSRLKIAKIIPIFKSGQRKLPENYRPISILSSLSKILENLMYARLIDHLTMNRILIPQQFGFRKNCSPQNAILTLLDKITQALDEKQVAIGLLLDLSKAFDCINHQIVLKKLKHYGVCGISLKWFQSYLSDRSQYVLLNEVKSNKLLTKTGVPRVRS